MRGKSVGVGQGNGEAKNFPEFAASFAVLFSRVIGNCMIFAQERNEARLKVSQNLFRFVKFKLP